MVSLLHEGVLKLVRDRPAFAADLLGGLLDVAVPSFTSAQIADVTLNQLAPIEYRADTVVMFTRDKPVFGAVIEAQLERDPDKRFTWPVYASVARAQHRCPFVVIVISPDAKTARWASRAIDMGGGNRYRPLVVGPEGIPKMTDRQRARREPQLAVLSTIAHGQGELGTAAAIGAAAVRAIRSLPRDQQRLYSLVIQASLSEAARKVIDMDRDTGPPYYFNEEQRRNVERAIAKGRARGRTEAKAEALLTILVRRGLKPTAEHRQRIVGCKELRDLDRWLDRSFSISSVTELFAPREKAAPRTKASRNGHRRGKPAASKARRAAR